MLIVATECKEIYVIEPNGMAIKHTFKVKSVPVQIDVQGQFDIEYRLLVACRDGKVY